MRKLAIIIMLSSISFGLVLPSVPNHGVLPGLVGQGVGGGADDHGLGSDDSPTFTGLTITDTIVIASNAPATSSSTGTEGTITYDNDYVYVCIATNTWERTAIVTWGIPAENVIYAAEDVIYAAEQVVYP